MISVIIPTRNRPAMLRRALESVLSQNIDEFEVIVIDDGSEPPVVVSAENPRIRLIRTEHRGVGAARATGLTTARGELIAYCDDDDEWLPNHLDALASYLLDHPNVGLVYGDSLWEDGSEAPQAAYSIDFEGSLLAHHNYIFATDVLHRADAARDVGGFDPKLDAHEDWDLWLRMQYVCRLRHLPYGLAIHHWHEGCVAAGDHQSSWLRVYEAHQKRQTAAGAAARHDLDLGGARRLAFDPRTWSNGTRELIWYSSHLSHVGYGSVGRQLLPAVERQEVDVTIAPSRNQPVRGLERFFKPLDHWGRLGLYYDYRVRPSTLPTERLVNYSMWETTRLPKWQVQEINGAAELQLVPCRQNLESFQESGVRVPIEVLHHGVDPELWPEVERYGKDVFVFGSFGALSIRKGIDLLIRAFEDEFRSDEPVSLLLKSTPDAQTDFEIRDPRIELISNVASAEELLSLLQRIDVYVLPSRGEGFGLTGLEAMSTGLPVIATNWSGPAEYLDPEYSFPLSYRMVDAAGTESNYVVYHGHWAEPDYEHLRHLMRWVFEHRDEAAHMGALAAKVTREDWTWDRVAAQLRQLLDDIA